MNDKFDELARRMALTVGAILLTVLFANGIASKLGRVAFPTPEQDIQVSAAVREEMAEKYGDDWLDQWRYMNRTNRAASGEMWSTFSNLCAQTYR